MDFSTKIKLVKLAGKELRPTPVTTATKLQNKNPDEHLICIYCSERGHRVRHCREWIKDGDIPPMPTSCTSPHNYRKVGAIVTENVYHLLDWQVHMSRLPVPGNSCPDTGTFIFASPEYDSKDTLLLLVHDSGHVLAGQWEHSVIIKENHDQRTQIPYIRKAVSKDYGVLVLNTNDNKRDGYKIPKSGSPDEHARYVWDTYVAKTKATSILIAAYSYGGLVTMNLAKKNKKDFGKRVKIAKNWVASQQPLDAPRGRDHDVPMVSAGHPKHEMTPYSCMDSVFEFFEEKLAKTASIESDSYWLTYFRMPTILYYFFGKK